jgi:uncharacterized protein (DUF1778 family)
MATLDLKKRQPRSVWVHARVRPEDARLIESAVAVSGLSRSDFLRRVIVSQSKEVVLGAGQE